MGSMCGEEGTPTRMRSNAVGGWTRTLCLAWEVAIMMPLHALTFASEAKSEIEAKILFRLEAKKMPDFTWFTLSEKIEAKRKLSEKSEKYLILP